MINEWFVTMKASVSKTLYNVQLYWLKMAPLLNLNNYFDFHVRLSIRSSFRSSFRSLVRSFFRSCVRKVRVLEAKSDCSHRGAAEVRIFNFKTTWSEFPHLPRVSPKQLCALAHLGCTRAAGTS